MLRLPLVRYSGHAFLIETAQTLHYKPDTKGICEGVFDTAMLDFLADEIQAYNTRLIQLYKTWERMQDLKSFATKQGQSKNPQYKEWKSAIQEHRLCLDSLQTNEVFTFFNDVMLFQDPQNYPDKVGKYLHQSQALKVSSVIKNHKITHLGGLAQAGAYLSHYTQKDLTLFLNLIAEHVTDNKIVISFSFNGHKSGLCYNGKSKTWIFIDANQLPPHPLSFKVLAQRTFAAHSFNNESFNSAPISIRVFTTKNDYLKLQAQITNLENKPEFQALQKITLKNALLPFKNGITLMHAAAIHNHYEVMNRLLNVLHLNPNLATSHNETALTLAASCGHTTLVELLLKNKLTDIDWQDSSESSALFIAVHNNDLDMVTLLLKYKADPYLRCSDKMHAVTLAARNSNLEMLKLFAKNDIDLFKPDTSSKNALDYAKEEQDRPTINFLADQLKEIMRQEKIKKLSQSGSSSLRKHSMFSLPLIYEKKPALTDNRPPKKIKLIVPHNR